MGDTIAHIFFYDGFWFLKFYLEINNISSSARNNYQKYFSNVLFFLQTYCPLYNILLNFFLTFFFSSDFSLCYYYKNLWRIRQKLTLISFVRFSDDWTVCVISCVTKWASCGSEEKRKEIPHLQYLEREKGVKRTGMLRWMHFREARSLRTRYPKVWVPRCCGYRHIGGPLSSSSTGLIVLFIIRLDKRFTGPGNKEESGRNGEDDRWEKEKTIASTRNPGIRRLLESPLAFDFHVAILSHARWPRRCLLQRVSEICDISGLT